MKTKEEVLVRIKELQDNISLIDSKLSEEMSKGVYKRDYRLLRFLNRELGIWEMAVFQLEWFIGE
jgi:hypothetical protein